MTNDEGQVFPLRVMSFMGERAESQTTVFFESFFEGGVEYVFKLLDGCGFNSHFWGFLSGTLTNQETYLLVEDTEAGQARTFTNAPGNVASGFTDVEYFATCD